MRVLGIEIISADPCWIVLDGDNTPGYWKVSSHPDKITTSEEDEVGNLLQLKQVVTNILQHNRIEKVGIIRAGKCAHPCAVKSSLLFNAPARS